MIFVEIEIFTCKPKFMQLIIGANEWTVLKMLHSIISCENNFKT